MQKLKKHGIKPYTTAIIHGGPGAAGEVTVVAEKISLNHHGVLEPFQQANSLQGQIKELKLTIKKLRAQTLD